MHQFDRRTFLLAGLGWLNPFSWFHRTISIAGTRFQLIRHDGDRRHYIWIHGNETTARDVLRDHIRKYSGRAFLIENGQRNIHVDGGLLDPNRMFSRAGAGNNLRRLNPKWTDQQVQAALDFLERDREHFLNAVLPKDGQLLVALHNNSSGYSANDEVPISDAVSLKKPAEPHEFMLCTMRADFNRLSQSPFNVLLQNTAPPEDDGSLSRLTATRGLRYVNIEAGLGNREAQQAMLDWIEVNLK